MRISILAVIAAASLACAIAGPAAAGNCVTTTRSESGIQVGNDNVRVRTVVKNMDEDTDYEVVIYNDNNEVDKKTLSEGETLETNDGASGGNNPKWHMKILIDPVDRFGQGGAACFYDVTASGGCGDSACSVKSTWNIWDDKIEPCSGPWEVTCEKTWRPSHRRWVTTLTIEGK